MFPCIFACVCVPVFIHVHVYVYMCMHIWRPEVGTRSLPRLLLLLFCFEDRVSHLTCNSRIQLGWLLSQAQRSSLCLPCARVTGQATPGSSRLNSGLHAAVVISCAH